jgi:hypothetical protein
MYNFTLDHDYKFKTIIMFKDVWISKSKKIYAFFFGMFWTHGSLLMESIKVHKKNETIRWTFDNEKKLLIQKNHMCACFLFNVLNI